MIISVYGIARLEEQAPSLLGRRQWKVQGPAVAYRALFLTGEGPCNYNAHSSGSSSPTSNAHRILPNPLQERSQSLHAIHFKERTRNQHIRRICVLVCAELETSRRYLFRPSLTQTRAKYESVFKVNFGHTGRNTKDSSYLSFPLRLSSPPLLLLY